MQFSQFKSRWELPIIAMIFLAVFAMSLPYVDFLITRAKVANVFSAWQTGKMIVAEHVAWHGNFPTIDTPANVNTEKEEMYPLKIVNGIVYGSVKAQSIYELRLELFSADSVAREPPLNNTAFARIRSYTFPMRPGTVKTEVSPTLVWACGASSMPTQVRESERIQIEHSIELLPHVCRRDNEGKDYAN